MPFKSKAQQATVMMRLARRLARVAGVTSQEAEGIFGFKYHPLPHNLRTAFKLDPNLRKKDKEIVYWEQKRTDEGYGGHYQQYPPSIWVRNNKLIRQSPGAPYSLLDLTEGEKVADARAAKRTLKHEIGHHVWTKLDWGAKQKLRADHDFRYGRHGELTIKQSESNYRHNADTEAFARMYTDVRGVKLKKGYKQIPYHQHRRQLIAGALRSIRERRRRGY